MRDEKTTRSGATHSSSLLSQPSSLWTTFWFHPADPVALHCLRFLGGLLFLFWVLPFVRHYQALFGLSGWLDRQAYVEASALPDGPPSPIGWSLFFIAGNQPALLTAFFWGGIVILVSFTAGLWPRITGTLSWLFVVSFLANPVTGGEADQLFAFFAFYLVLGYLLLGQWHGARTWLGRLVGPDRVWPLRALPASGTPAGEGGQSYAANLAVRLLQVHFAIVVVIGGLQKLQSGDWWSGVAFWYPLHPPFETMPERIQAEAASATSTLFWLSLAQYIYLGWELAFPFFAWRKRWRPLLLGGAVIGWIGPLAIYRAPLFGPAYLFGCLAYLTPEEWSWALDKIGQGGKTFAIGPGQPAERARKQQQARA